MKLRRKWIVAGVFLAALLVAKHFLLDVSPVPSSSDYRIDLDALHRAATASGPLPVRIDVEKIEDMKMPGAMAIAGGPFSMNAAVVLAHRVVFADGNDVVIDSAMSGEQFKSSPMGGSGEFHAPAYAALQSAMKKARAVVFTHEHPDHIGGFIASIADVPHPLVTPEQVEGLKKMGDAKLSDPLAKVATTSYSGLDAIAPGVVLQKAPGHSLGSQLVYVELANGNRFLFVGDVAWSEASIRTHTGRPKLIQLVLHEDGAQVAAELASVANLPPEVHVIVAHDSAGNDRDVASGLIHAGFTD